MQIDSDWIRAASVKFFLSLVIVFDQIIGYNNFFNENSLQVLIFSKFEIDSFWGKNYSRPHSMLHLNIIHKFLGLLNGKWQIMLLEFRTRSSLYE